MSDTLCTCLIRHFFSKGTTENIISSVFEFLLSLIISICGVFLNYKFLKKLRIERRNKPIGRKGNVIEPIMRWFGVLQIAYWPYELFMFSQAVGIANLASITPPLCPFYLWSVILGRAIVAYNSLFVALIRYVYIVHERKANQWDFELVGKRFQIASIFVPFLVQVFWCFTFDWSYWIKQVCQLKAQSAQNSSNCIELAPMEVAFTLTYVPEPVVHTFGILTMIVQALVYLNVTEAFLYAKIFQTIKR